MEYNLFLDDLRMPRDAYFITHDVRYNIFAWDIARSYAEFVKMIEAKGLPKLVAFDHDLADEHYDECQKPMSENHYSQLKEKTGYHAAKFLINLCIDRDLDIPDYLIHTQNPGGGLNIKSIMESGKTMLKMIREAKERGETLPTLPDYTKEQ